MAKEEKGGYAISGMNQRVDDLGFFLNTSEHFIAADRIECIPEVYEKTFVHGWNISACSMNNCLSTRWFAKAQLYIVGPEEST